MWETKWQDPYCKECTHYLFGSDIEHDFQSLCEEGECVEAKCTHCGFILVDHTGTNVRGQYSGAYVNQDT